MSFHYMRLFLVIMNLLGSEADYTNTLRSKYKLLGHQTNVNFSVDILWRENVDDVNICGLKCFRDSRCQSFGYNINTHTCQSHRSCFLTPAENTFTTTRDSKYYSLNDGQCSRRFSEKKIIWKFCKPSLELFGSIGHPVHGRRVVIEGILGNLGLFRVCFCSDRYNCEFTLTFRIMETSSHVATHRIVNGDYIDGIILIKTPDFPIAVDSLFCLEILIKIGKYQMTLNNKYLLEHIATADMDIDHLLQIRIMNNFTLHEVSVIGN